MKVLVSWLRELVDAPVPPAVLAHDLHMAGFEVASVGSAPRPDGVGLSPEPADAPDAVIDFEITANRPDCLSMIGLAREVATRYGTTLRDPRVASLGTSDPARLGPLTVTVEHTTACPRYCAAVADVTIGPSPAWMTDRLTAAGIRAINNIVDITNYVLLELGHPLHAFDLRRLGGHALHIRSAHAGEALTTLDGQRRTLTPEMLVIADSDRAQALAGIMGGGDSEVSASTTTIVLESAWFEPTSIRKTSKRLGLSTEASYRFERGADFTAAQVALARACHLIAHIGAGTVRPGWIDAIAVAPAPRQVRLAYARVGAVLGAEIAVDDVRRILTSLGFVLSNDAAGHALVTVPSWRGDVARDIDLIEDVARHYGYDHLPATFPALSQVPPPPDARLEQDRRLRRLSTAAGFSECVTFSFIAEPAAGIFSETTDVVGITNPLSESFAVLRPSLLPGLVTAVGHNLRHGTETACLFELGTRFVRTQGERRTLSLAVAGKRPAHWADKEKELRWDFFDLRGVVERLTGAFSADLDFIGAAGLAFVDGRSSGIAARSSQPGTSVSPGAHLGLIGLLQPAVAEGFGVPKGTDVFVAELDVAVLTQWQSHATVRVESPPRYPSIVRDLSILVDESLLAAQVRGTIQAVAPPTLVRAAEFDRYQGKGIPERKVSVSYRLTFQAPDRTMTDAQADAAMTAIVDALATTHGAVRR